MEQKLSRRERQIVEFIYKIGHASAAEVRAGMADPPGYSAVRATLRILEETGVVRHEEKDGRYVYFPVIERDAARRSALSRLIDTFFDGSAGQAAAALLGSTQARFTAGELDRLEELVRKAREQ